MPAWHHFPFHNPAPFLLKAQYGCGLVDWRDGWLDWERAPGRRAAPFCAQLRRAVERSQARGRVALVLLDNLGIHTPKGSLLLRQLLTELRGQLVLVYTPTYDPDANRTEWLWRSLRRGVTHTHTLQSLLLLLEDADTGRRPSPQHSFSARSAPSPTHPDHPLTRNSPMLPNRQFLPGSI